MGDAFWLLLVLPAWFARASFAFISGAGSTGWLGAVPTLGLLALVVGLGASAAVMDRRARLTWFLASPLLSEVFVAGARMFRGKVEAPTTGHATGAFLVVQLCLCLVLIANAKGARFAAMALSVFSVCYALFATFVAGMAFRGDWA